MTKKRKQATENTHVNIEIQVDDKDPSKIGFYVESSDGSALSAQQIIDAIAEALLMEFDQDFSMKSVSPDA